MEKEKRKMPKNVYTLILYLTFECLKISQKILYFTLVVCFNFVACYFKAEDIGRKN